MAGEIKAATGFLTSNGQLKDKKVLETEKQQEVAAAPEEIRETSTEDQSLGNALSSVRSRVDKKINSIINIVNQDQDSLKKAGANVKAQIQVAKELKQAIKEKDPEKIESKRGELSRLQEEKSALAEKSVRDNQRVAPERRQSVNLGNKQLASIQTSAVSIRESNPAKTESAEDIDKLISDLQGERDEIRAQQQDLRAVKKQLKSVSGQARNELSSIEQRSLNSFEEADRSAQKLAGDIVKTGAQAINVSRIDESVVKELLAA